LRGRKPKPISQQLAEGDPRKHGVGKLEKRLEAEQRAEHGLPDAPAHLGEIAAHAWQMWKEELEKMRLDFRPDQVMLEGACVSYERARAADELITKHGPLISEPIFNKEGERTGSRIKTNPAIAISNKSWVIVRSFCSEFGLSPVSRTRLSIKEQGDSQADLMKLLSAPREKKELPVQ
jgi:P27 family predicted phage terminase small subunit